MGECAPARESLLLEIPCTGDPPELVFYAAVEALAKALGLALEFCDEPGEPLLKGVDPHGSHFRPRGAGGQFRPAPQFHPVPRLSGEERAQAEARAGELVAELEARLLTHLSDQQAGKLAPEEWFGRCAGELKLFYAEVYRCGKRAAGLAQDLTPQDKAALGRLVEDELSYLAGFREHLETGGGKLPYPQRMRLYAQAVREAFWTGWALADQSPERLIRWVYGQTEEHCADCKRFVELGWLPAPEFVKRVLSQGYAPQGGRLECQGHHCRCRLEEMHASLAPVAEAPVAEAPIASPAAPESAPGTATAPEAGANPPENPASRHGEGSIVLPAAPDTAAPSSSQSGDSPIQGTEDAPASSPDGRIAQLLAGPFTPLQPALFALGLIPLLEREDALRDAAAYLFLNEREQAAYENDPEALRRLQVLAGRKAARWLALRHRLGVEQAEGVLRLARGLHAYTRSGRLVRWLAQRWPEPRLADYPDLEALYREARG